MGVQNTRTPRPFAPFNIHGNNTGMSDSELSSQRRQDFHYDLPLDLIAQHPPARRDDSRLLTLDGVTGAHLPLEVCERGREAGTQHRTILR